MTTITKTECEAILERLTDKTFSFEPGSTLVDWRGVENGLIFLRYIGDDLLFYDKQKDANQIYTKLMLAYSEGIKINPKPVTLLDVLAKKSQDFWMEPMKVGTSNLDKLYFYWSECGIQTPLRDILEGAKWEEETTAAHRFSKAEHMCSSACIVEVLKDKKVEALFLFLKQINL